MLIQLNAPAMAKTFSFIKILFRQLTAMSKDFQDVLLFCLEFIYPENYNAYIFLYLEQEVSCVDKSMRISTK